MKYNNITYRECEHVYPPAEDTFLLIDNLEVEEKMKVLEIGGGTGIVSIACSMTAKKVTVTDINPYAIECMKHNIRLNGRKNIEVIEGNLFEKISGQYDLILFNTPYLPVPEEERESDGIYQKAWDGGEDGREVIDKFLMNAGNYLHEHGKIQLVQSSFSDNEKTIKYLTDNGYTAMITDSIHMFFEDITLITATRV